MELADSALFNGISKEEIISMTSCFNAKMQHFLSGDTIYDFSQGSREIGLIENGTAYMMRIDINGNRTILEHLKSGSIFGDTIAFSGITSDSIFIQCDRECDVLFIPCSNITTPCCNGCSHHALLLKNLFYIMSAELLSMSRRVEVLSHRTIREKLMCYFNICAAAKGSRTFTLPFSLNALADYICSDRSAMMRELKNMKDEGIISSERKIITIN
jgi:CRP-like cAMP-binding protein